MNRQILDAMYEELFSSRAEIARLERVNTFSVCESCNGSPDAERHDAELRAANSREALADSLIKLMLEGA